MKITLALSGGGVKGFAHIGVLQVLERQGFQICGIAGTSAGGLVGALYAAGFSAEEIGSRLVNIDQGNLFARMHGDGPALLGFRGITSILVELLGERNFDSLRIPLAITATDLTTGTPVILTQGRLVDALLATSAVPGVFPPQTMDGHQVVDGGIMNPVPIAVARSLAPTLPVVAVVLSPPLGWQGQNNDGSPPSVPLLMTDLPLVYRLAGRLRLAKAFSIFIHSMDLTGQMLLDSQLKLEKPDVVIRPGLGKIAMVDRVNIPDVITLGEQAAIAELPHLHIAVSWRKRISRHFVNLLHQG